MLNKFNIKFKKKIRIGRGIGSGFGKTCGKGHKGQKARAGCSIRLNFEGGQTPLNMRIPKFGFTSRKNLFKYTLNSSVINKLNLSYLDLDLLKKKKIIKSSVKSIKIVYSEPINICTKLYNIHVSKKVKEEIYNLGGSINFGGGGI